MELIRKPIHYTQAGKEIFHQFYLDEDYNVPEQKEDVQRIICGSAQLKTGDIRPVENGIRVTGHIRFRILYMASAPEPVPEVLEGQVPFDETVYTESDGNETFYTDSVRTEFTPAVINGRKLTLRFMSEMEIGRERIRDAELTEDVECGEPLCRKKRTINLLKLAVSKKDTYRIREEVSLPGTKESIGKVLVSDVSLRRLDIRPGQDEIYLRGELQLFCMYLSAMEKADWLEQSVPFEGRVLCDGVTENMYYHIRHELTDVLTEIRPDEDGELRLIGIEGMLALEMNLYEEEETEILEDLYSLDQVCTFDTEEAVPEELLMQNQSRCRVTERLSLPELKDDVLQIIHSTGDIRIEQKKYEPGGIRVEGILQMSFLYLRGSDDEPYGNWQGMIPFSYLIEYGDMPDGVSDSLSGHTEQLSVTLAGSEAVDVKAVLRFDVFLRRMTPVRVITEVSLAPQDMEQAASGPGIVGHIVQDGEDLWGLAKRYMTTVQGIMEINGLGEEKVSPGDKLLIFKENVSIL